MRVSLSSWYNKFKKEEKKPIVVWIYTLVPLILFSLLGDFLSAQEIWIEDKYSIPNNDILLFITIFSLYIFFAWILFSAGKSIFPQVKEASVERDPTQSKVLICNVSNLFRVPENKLALPFDLEKDLKALSELEENGLRWNWTQFLRGVNAHKSTLEILYLIVTEDFDKKDRIQKGSHIYSKLARDIMNKYLFDYNFEVVVHDKKVKPEAIVDSYEIYNQLLDEIIYSNSYKDSDIAIDITEGYATMSISGAVSTLQNKVAFQYVSKNGFGQSHNLT